MEMDTKEASVIAGSVGLISRGWTFACENNQGRWMVCASHGEIRCHGEGLTIGDAFLRAEQEALTTEMEAVAA
jgi:hypothetical protein